MHRVVSAITLLGDDEVIGLNLGSEPVSAHNHGISDNLRSFGVCKNDQKGYARGLISGLPGVINNPDASTMDVFALVETGQELVLFYERFRKGEIGHKDVQSRFANTSGKILVVDGPLPERIREHVRFYNSDWCAAWGGRGFLIGARGEVARGLLKSLARHFENLDITISQEGVKYSCDGLCFRVFSKIPERDKQRAISEDLEKEKLQLAAENTRIVDLLSKHGKKFYALMPSWANDEKNELKFWLNPSPQSFYKDGWYTLDELRLWCEDKGPVMA